MGLLALTAQDPQLVRVGRVRAIYWPHQEAAATVLAEIADAAGPWPGIQNPDTRPVRLILAPDGARFDSLTRGRVPEWSAGAAFPGSNTVIVQLSGDARRVLLHEMAHLALPDSASQTHSRRPRAPSPPVRP